MGVYLYTIRAKSQQVLIDGNLTAVHHYQYAFKFHSYNSKGQEFAIQNFYRHAESAFANRKSNYVVLCGDDGMADGDVIYENVTSSCWEDTGKFHATPLGFAKKLGRRWVVRDMTDFHWESRGWVLGTAGGPMLPYVARSRMQRNLTTGLMEVVSDRQYANHDTKQFITLEAAIELGMAREVAVRQKEEAEKAQWAVVAKQKANPGTQFSLF